MSRKFITLLLGAAAIAAFPAQAGPRMTPEQQLEKALEGRVAGEPVDCVSLTRTHSSRVIDRTAILFDSGSTIYVNRPRSGAESLTPWNVQVINSFDSRLCSIDTIKMVDRSSGIYSGAVFLGEFVPYRRVRD